MKVQRSVNFIKDLVSQAEYYSGLETHFSQSPICCRNEDSFTVEDPDGQIGDGIDIQYANVNLDDSCFWQLIKIDPDTNEG